MGKLAAGAESVTKVGPVLVQEAGKVDQEAADGVGIAYQGNSEGCEPGKGIFVVNLLLYGGYTILP